MNPRRLTVGAAALVLAAMLLGACGSSVSKAAPSKSVLKACMQLDKQPKERAAAPSGYSVYVTPPSLTMALQNSGDAALERLGRQLVVPGTDSKVGTSVPRAFDQGQTLCHSLIH
jgi:hypothetical protein